MATIDDDRVEGWEIDGSMTSTTSVALSDDHSHQKINDPVKKQDSSAYGSGKRKKRRSLDARQSEHV